MNNPNSTEKIIEEIFTNSIHTMKMPDGSITTDYSQAIEKARKALNEVAERAREITGETSDGYHTFNELYEFRKVFNAVLFNQWADLDLYDIHKSKKHFDGEDCFGGGWFIVMAQLPTGQISNHYELKDWDLFRCEERERANEWDGHTAQDVLERLKKIIKSKPEGGGE